MIQIRNKKNIKMYHDGHMKMMEYLNIEEFNHFAFPLTNSCNLSCNCCSVHADLNIDKDSIYPERRTLYRMKNDEIIRILDGLGNLGKDDWHRLTGGEPTLFLDDCINAIELLYNDNRKNICLATNGFHLMDLPLETLNMIHWIELDYHGVNDELIRKILQYLKKHYKHYLRLIKYNKHYDLHYARFHRENQYYCGHIVRVIKFRDNIIYPCGHYECLTTFRHDTEIQDLLKKYHWTLDNKDIPFLLKHWRETIPLDIFKYCMSCWRPHENLKVLDQME